MSKNCINCVKNERTGPDLLCDECRAHPSPPDYPGAGTDSSAVFDILLARWEHRIDDLENRVVRTDAHENQALGIQACVDDLIEAKAQSLEPTGPRSDAGSEYSQTPTSLETGGRNALNLQMARIEQFVAAAKRAVKGVYVPWHNSGGPEECKHGYAAGIPCPKCDLKLIEDFTLSAQAPDGEKCLSENGPKSDAVVGASSLNPPPSPSEANAKAMDGERKSTDELPYNAAVIMFVQGGHRYVKWVGGNDLYDAPNWVWQLVAAAERNYYPSLPSTIKEHPEEKEDLGEQGGKP